MGFRLNVSKSLFESLQKNNQISLVFRFTGDKPVLLLRPENKAVAEKYRRMFDMSRLDDFNGAKIPCFVECVELDTGAAGFITGIRKGLHYVNGKPDGAKLLTLRIKKRG